MISPLGTPTRKRGSIVSAPVGNLVLTSIASLCISLHAALEISLVLVATLCGGIVGLKSPLRGIVAYVKGI